MKALYLILFFLISLTIKGQQLVINEIVASNQAGLKDEDGDAEDWIELFNPGPNAISLSGYGLSDDTNQLFRFVLPAISMEPNSFLLIWASGKNRKTPGQPIHTNFKISASGEALFLTSPDTAYIHVFPAVALPPDMAYGCQPDGSANLVFFPAPTPGSSNTTPGYIRFLQPPILSRGSGFYKNSFSLQIESPEPGTQILYTLDGSEPDTNNLNGRTYRYKKPFPYTQFLAGDTIKTHVYQGPIQIINRTPLPNRLSKIPTSPDTNTFYLPTYNVLKSTVVKAKVFAPGSLPSPTKTATYIVHNDSVNLFKIPVITLSFDEDRLFDYDTGIYVPGRDFDTWRMQFPNALLLGNIAGNFRREGWVNANFQFLEGGKEALNQGAEIRIAGQFSRNFRIKSLKLKALEKDKDIFGHRFFKDIPDSTFSTLTLRNAGNDWNLAYMRDAVTHRICQNLTFPIERYQPSAVFFNGEYWGMLNLRERQEAPYLKRYFGLEKEDIDLIVNNKQADLGDTTHYGAMMAYFKNNSLIANDKYEYIRTQMDVENFTDYYVSNIFVNNFDWPFNNIQCFRKRTSQYLPNAPKGQDGRWRWMMHDTDFGLGNFVRPPSFNSLLPALSTAPDYARATMPIRRLLENQTYKTHFINRFADLMNSTFAERRTVPILNQMQQYIAPEIPRHTARWRDPSSLGGWNVHVNTVRKFLNERKPFMEKHIAKYFGLDTFLVAVRLSTADSTQGFVRINTLDIKQGTDGFINHATPWKGRYFKGVPVAISAVALPGFQFSHWEGDLDTTQNNLQLVLSDSLTLRAVFTNEVIEPLPHPIVFWFKGTGIQNDAPLLGLPATHTEIGDVEIAYQSCLEGYPFAPGHPNWRIASMERRNLPTPINYRPSANNQISFDSTNMRGIQIKRPYRAGENESSLLIKLFGFGHEIAVSFAAVNENGADSIRLDYRIHPDSAWTNHGIEDPVRKIENEYRRFHYSLSAIDSSQYVELDIRLRFIGQNLEANNGGRVMFNNFAIDGHFQTWSNNPVLRQNDRVFPNPFHQTLTIKSPHPLHEWKLYTITGQLVKSGKETEIYAGELPDGVYFLSIFSGNGVANHRVIKQ